MEARRVAEASVDDSAVTYRSSDCAVRVFSLADSGSIHRLLEIHAFRAAAHRECPAWPAAADLCRPVWLEGDGPGRGGRVPQAASRRAEVVRDSWAELRAGGRDRFFWGEDGIAASDFGSPELFLLGTARVHGRVHDRDGRHAGASGQLL